MKVIFLDIDGVLNHAGCAERSQSGFLGIEVSKVRRLRRIIDVTGAKVVLVSTWKEEWEPNLSLDQQKPDAIYMIQQLEKENVTLLDRTYDQIADRGQGIVSWLSLHPDVESFVILDDDTFKDYEPLLLIPHHVKTTFAYGLLDKHVTKAIKILMKES